MSPEVRALDASEIDALIDALGDASPVNYAPPSIYPMSAPAFAAASDADRGAQPKGPLGVYVHVPFCNYKCTFCFYATRSVPDAREMARYVAALERELSWIRPGTALTQLYVGGGTPTALPPDLLDRLLGSVFARVVRGPEVCTVECSPESLTEEHVRVVARHGVERVSMGVQTTDEKVLETTHRRHDNRQVAEACERVVLAGLLLNIDLIYGLPGQTEAAFRADFEAVAGMGVHSVTCYNLRVNEKTSIGRLIPDEARLDAVRLVRWREAALDVAHGCGFEQTRPHTFRRVEPRTAADAARRFRDDTGRGEQFGAGVSARSRLRDTVYRNTKEYGGYLARVEGGRSPVEEIRALNDVERRLRFVTLTLGDGRPLERDAYERAFATPFDDDFGACARRLVEEGVVVDDGRRLDLSERGRLVYDLAIRAFYPEPVRRWMEERRRLVESSPNLRPRAR